MPAGGLEIVHQKAAENRVGALGESCSWRIWPAIYAAVLAVGALIGGELDALEARAETAARDPDVFAVSRRTGREALGQDALKLRFVGSAELLVMVVVQLARDR